MDKFEDNNRGTAYQKSRLRALLGRGRYWLVDHPAGTWHIKRAAHLKETLGPLALSLPPAPSGHTGPINVHMICCESQTHMGLWAGWSLMRFMPEAGLYIHSDGTLNEANFAPWRRVLPGAVLVTPEDGAQRAEEALPGCPVLRAWRKTNVFNLKFTDPHLFGTSPCVMLLDSDILFFQPPREVLERVAAEPRTFLWNRDAGYSYMARLAELREFTGVPVPEGVNAGFMVIPRYTQADWETAERLVAKINDAPEFGFQDYRRTHLYEQTMQAVMAAAVGAPDSRALPPSYAIAFRRTQPSMVMRHYVGYRNMRPRYWTEGVTRLLSQLREAGHAMPAQNRDRNGDIDRLDGLPGQGGTNCGETVP